MLIDTNEIIEYCTFKTEYADDKQQVLIAHTIKLIVEFEAFKWERLQEIAESIDVENDIDN